MERIKLSDLEARAEQMGLSISYWGPGDGRRRYKVFDKPSVDYFQADGIYCTDKIAEVQAFLSGYARCLYSDKARGLLEAAIQANTAIEATRKGERTGGTFAALSFAGDKLCAALGIVRN